MYRFYSSPSTIFQDNITVTDSQTIGHIRKVLRLKAGDVVVVFDGTGAEYNGNISVIDKAEIKIEIKSRSKKALNNKAYIAIACAIPKKSKFDDIVDKLTQLGVNEIIPLNTERTIVKGSHLERWIKIAINASEQSKRIDVPKINDLTDFKEILPRIKEFTLAIIPNLEGQRQDLKKTLSKKADRILVLIGPEGDFTPEEVGLAQKQGCIPVSFGDLVFRVETAAIYVASILRYENI